MCVIRKEDSGIGCMRQMINGVGLTSFDFGDAMTNYCQETGEMPRTFVPKPATADVLEKYHITEDEYQEVCGVLVQQFADWDEARRGCIRRLYQRSMHPRLWTLHHTAAGTGGAQEGTEMCQEKMPDAMPPSKNHTNKAVFAASSKAPVPRWALFWCGWDGDGVDGWNMGAAGWE